MRDLNPVDFGAHARQGCIHPPALAGLSPVCGKPIIARFDGGQLSSDAGVLALREIEARLGTAEPLAACVSDPRAPERVIHRVADILRFRMLMIATGHEDGNDADGPRHDPAFKLALGRLPDGAAPYSQPTISTGLTTGRSRAGRIGPGVARRIAPALAGDCGPGLACGAGHGGVRPPSGTPRWHCGDGRPRAGRRATA